MCVTLEELESLKVGDFVEVVGPINWGTESGTVEKGYKYGNLYEVIEPDGCASSLIRLLSDTGAKFCFTTNSISLINKTPNKSGKQTKLTKTQAEIKTIETRLELLKKLDVLECELKESGKKTSEIKKAIKLAKAELT